MSVARVLHLTARTLTVQRWHGERVQEVFAFGVDMEGMESYARYIAATPNERTLLLVDRVEEEFTVENLPHAVGRARTQLHARRGERLFRATPFRATVTLGRESAGRRDDRVLISALTQPDVLLPWLQPLLEAGVPLQAVSSAAHVSGKLPRALGVVESELLLVFRDEEGLRQTYFQGGQLRLSRRSISPGLDPPAILEEIARTRRYLNGTALLDDGVDLPVCLLADDPLIAELERCPLPEGVRLRLGAVDEAASILGPGACGVLGAAGLLGGLFHRAPQNRYASALHRAGWRAYLLRSWVEWSGMAAALLLCLSAIASALGALDAQQTALALKTQLARDKTQVEGTPTETLPDGLTAEQISATVESAERMSRLPMRPDEALIRLGAVLNTEPECSLQRLRWAASTDAGFTDLPAEGDGYSAAPSSGAANAGEERVYQSLLINGRIDSRSGAPHTGPERVTSVLARFEGMPEVVEATLLSTPVDPAGPVKVSVGRDDPAPGGFPFTLRVVLRP